MTVFNRNVFFSDSEDLIYNNLKWMPVKSTDAGVTYLQIDTHPELVVDPFRDRVEFWESLSIPS